jgi:DNA recombination protein RmuC
MVHSAVRRHPVRDSAEGGFVTVEAVLLGLVVVLLLAVLGVLFTRKPGADPALPLLQAAQERQGERLGALTGEVKAALAASEAALGAAISGFAIEQAKLLNEAQHRQTTALAALEKSLLERLAADASRTRDVLDQKLTEMRETSEKRLAEIQKSVNEQLAGAVEKQMNESFQRVIDQFSAIQQMMANVQSVATQVGDLKRIFGNIKTRGGWGEAQLKTMLDDFLPPGAYETNVKLREDSNDTVEFCILMPGGEDRARLPLDAKFPSEDYERLVQAHEAGDLAAEATARRAIEARVRGEAAKIAQKYICPPRSTDYAILFLPTEGLYAEVARIPGLVEDVARSSKVFIAGPFLLPALLKNIHLGYMSHRLSKSAEGVRDLLAATKTEMAKMEGVFERLGKQVGTVSNTIGTAQQRTRAIARKLRSLDSLPGDQAEQLLEIETEIIEMQQDDEAAS